MSLASQVTALATRVATEFNTLRGQITTSLAAKVDTNDSRLSDARTPTAHTSSHIAGGADPLMGAATTVSASHPDATTGYTTTSTTYVAISTSVGVVFVAPPSGVVVIEVSGGVINSTTAGYSRIAPEVKTGTTIGSGTTFLAASDINSASSSAASPSTVERSSAVTGLTAGASYNVRVMQKTSSGTSTCVGVRVIVHPELG